MTRSIAYVDSPYTLRVASAFPMLEDAEHVYSPKSVFSKRLIFSSLVVFHSSSGCPLSSISYLPLLTRCLTLPSGVRVQSISFCDRTISRRAPRDNATRVNEKETRTIDSSTCVHTYPLIITCSFLVHKLIVFGYASIKQINDTSVSKGELSNWLGTLALGGTEIRTDDKSRLIRNKFANLCKRIKKRIIESCRNL